MARQKKKVKLADNDWSNLFPGEEFVIANTKLTLEPMSLKTLSFVLRKFGELSEQMPKEDLMGMLSDTSNPSKNMVQFVAAIMEEVPEVLSEMSGLDKEDVQNLPLEIGVELFTKCVEINLEAKDSMLKNLKKLGEGMAQMTDNGMPKKKVDPIGLALTAGAA